MYVSIGGDMAIRTSSLIGIFDLDQTTTSQITRRFLQQAEREGQVVSSQDLPTHQRVWTAAGLSHAMECGDSGETAGRTGRRSGNPVETRERLAGLFRQHFVRNAAPAHEDGGAGEIESGDLLAG